MCFEVVWVDVSRFLLCAVQKMSNPCLSKLAMFDFVYTDGLEKVLDTVYTDLKEYCQTHSLQLHMQNLTKTLVGYRKSSDFPSGFLVVFGLFCRTCNKFAVVFGVWRYVFKVLTAVKELVQGKRHGVYSWVYGTPGMARDRRSWADHANIL